MHIVFIAFYRAHACLGGGGEAWHAPLGPWGTPGRPPKWPYRPKLLGRLCVGDLLDLHQNRYWFGSRFRLYWGGIWTILAPILRLSWSRNRLRIALSSAKTCVGKQHVFLWLLFLFFVQDAASKWPRVFSRRVQDRLGSLLFPLACVLLSIWPRNCDRRLAGDIASPEARTKITSTNEQTTNEQLTN